METPDKIYLVKDAANPEGIFDTVASNKPMFQDDECYIRMEALLEWLNERYKSTISNVGCYTGHSVWAEVIEHLNEM